VGSWNYDALVSAINNNVMTGTGGLIRPNELITVGQMYTYASNALGVTFSAPSGSSAIATREAMFILLAEITGAELAPGDNVNSYLNRFADASRVSASARADIAALVKARYITGVVAGGVSNLYPGNQLTRSEFAVLAHRLFGTYVNSGTTLNNNINGNVTIRASGVTLRDLVVTGDVIIGGGGGSRALGLTINNSTVSGRMVVRGNADVTANARAFVRVIHSYADLAYSGDATTINVRGDRSTVSFTNGYLTSMNVESNNNTITIGNGAEVRTVAVDGNGNEISGTGIVQNASFIGNTNNFNISGARIIDEGRNNITTSLTGTFNVTAVQITGATTIDVTFDARIQASPPPSAFTLSGAALARASSATPNTATLTNNDRTVRLTFNNATFTAVANLQGTITVAATLRSTERGTFGIKTLGIGQGSGNDPSIVFVSATNNAVYGTVSSIGTNSFRVEVWLPAGQSTVINFISGAANVTRTGEWNASNVALTTVNSSVHYNPLGGGNWGGGFFGGGFFGGMGGAFGFGTYLHTDGINYNVQQDAAGLFYMVGTVRHPVIDPNRWSGSAFGGFGGVGNPNLTGAGTLTINNSILTGTRIGLSSTVPAGTVTYNIIVTRFTP
jgi:hypothetical protein